MLAACGHKQPAPLPEADPAKVTTLAKALVENSPAPAGVKACTPADIAADAPLTQRSVLLLAQEPLSTEPTRADWVNPTELDHPAVATLLDPKADRVAQRQAAAQLLAAKGYVVYRVDMVNAPMALEVKELKRGALGMRAIGYDRKGNPTCASVFVVQNDKATAEWAMDKSDRARIDPAIAKALRDDLRAQLLKKAAEMGTPIVTASTGSGTSSTAPHP